MSGTSSRAKGRINVWLVEDSANLRETVEDLLNEQVDIMCTAAFPSAEALFDYLTDHFAPEIVLMDISLPGASGIEAVKRLKVISPATQVVMLTIHEDNDRIFQALCNGATGYLVKGIPNADLLEAIRDVAEGGAPMTQQVARRVFNMFAQLNQPREDYGLTNRERDVLRELVTGKSKKRIAADLDRSIHTVDTHLRNIYAKLHVHSKSGAVAKALQDRIV